MMKFTKELLENQVFEDSFLCKDYYPDNKNDGANRKPAAVLNADGSWDISLYAPEAKEVVIIAQYGECREDGFAPGQDLPLHGIRDDRGYYHFHLPYHETRTGSRSINVYIDGTLVVWPYLPVAFGSNRIQNFLEFPDSDMAFSYLYNVPHGAVISQMYFSSVTGRQERCMIYTPPGYQKDSQDYPVLYLLHGASDNETSWFTRARLNSILDNLLAEQKCVPFIVVAINDMYTGGKESADRKWEKTDGTTETVLIHDCIPFIESQYRVKTDQPDRAIGGLSLGALEACDCGFRHPELFGSMGFLTSILEHESYENALGRPWVKALQHPEKIMENYRLIFCSATPQEDHFPYFLNDAELFRKAGIEEKMSGYVRIAHDGRFTRWDSWRMGIRDFAVRLFRD